MDFEVRTESLGSWAVVVVRGEVDIANSPLLSDALVTAARGGKSGVVVHTDAVTFIDVSGVRALLGGLTECQRRGRRLVLATRSRTVHRLLELLDLAHRFPDPTGR